MRVADKHGHQGVITVAKRNLATVHWDDGTWSQVPVDTIHELSRRRTIPWHVIVAGAFLLLGLSIALGVWR